MIEWGQISSRENIYFRKASVMKRKKKKRIFVMRKKLNDKVTKSKLKFLSDKWNPS